MSEIKKKYFQQFSIPLNRQASEKVTRFLSSYKNSRYTDADDSTGTSAWYAVYAKRDEAGLDSGDSGVQQSKIATHVATLNEVEFNNKSLGGLINGDYDLVYLYGSQRANQKGNIILPLIQSEEVGNSIFLTKKDQPIIDQELVKTFADFSVEIVNSRTGRDTIDPKKLPLRFTLSGKGGFFDSSDASLIGHHLDVYYGDDFQSPLQGPFAEQHVGGYKHRHTEIGQSIDRPELYKIENYGGANKVQIFNPRQDFGGSTYDFDIPRVKFSREELVKRVYNTKNIKTTTSNLHLGNFTNNYEVVNTNGRRENNFAFVQQGGFNITGSESTAVSGVIDFTLPNRALSDGTYNKTVIVNRFSAPGEVATLSEGYLDVEATEYSPYNALPFRNREAVDNLNLFNQIPSAFGGYESGSTVTASYHKVQRNRVDKLRRTSAGTIYTGSQFDNGFVVHNIPRKDFGYRWITSSADPNLSMDGLYGFASSSDGVTFLSGALRGVGESEIVNFANYTTPASKIGSSGYHYEITTDSNLIVAPTAYTDGTQPSSASIYFLNVNGPYGHPSFKQIRGGQHPVARYLKRNNFIISDTDVGGLRINHSPVSSKYKPVIHNVKSEEVVGGEKIEKDLLLYYTYANNYDFYGNYYDYSGSKIDNPDRLKNFKNLDKRQSLFNAVSSLYTKGNNAIKLNSVVYGETIYPKETNAYLSRARDRSRFVFNWRDSLDNRVDQVTGSQNSTNFYSYWAMDIDSAKGELMDETSGSHASTLQVRYGRYRLSGSLTGYVDTTASSPRNTVQFGTSDSAGQGAFEDSYSEWNSDIRLIAKDHTIVPEYKISDHIAGIVSSGFDATNSTYQSLSLTGSNATRDNDDFLETYAHSDDIPAIEIVRETQEKDADKISINVSAVKKLLPYDGFYPVQRTLQLSTLFKDSLESNTTVRGADASFQTVNNTIFSRLTYGSIRAGVATDTAIWQSGTLLTDSFTPAASASTAFEILEYFNVEGLKFAISSSLGHEWFIYDSVNAGYPGDGSEPTPFVIVNTTDNATTAFNTQAIIAASSSVGIVSNRTGAILELTSSVDAGTGGNGNILYWEQSAIDTNYVTGSTFDLTGTVTLDTVTAYTSSFAGGVDAVTNKSFNPTASWSRLPFETIISPSTYLNSSTSLVENDPENPFDSTASVNFVGGTYELAASNFYAGVVDTFIENKTLTTIKTSPQSEWSFSDATLNNYVMDVVVSKPDGFSNHDDPAANGAPYTAHACFYQPLNYDGEEWWTKHITNGSSSVNAEIPPAASWSENEAIVTINFDYNAFKTAVTERDKPNFGDILQYSTRTFKNKQMFDQLGTTDATSTSSNSSQFMTIEAGVDLFNFDSNTEQWVINTKCEFPVHNVFDEEGNALDALYPDGTDGSTGTAAGDVNRGVWHQFSPLRESKLKLGVVGPDLTNNRESGSLAQACGFETEQKTISQIASSAKLKEYLVVIPFVTNECDEETFFHYPIDEFERAYAAIPTGNPQPTALATSAIQTRSTTLTDSLAKQRELILPPTLSYMAKRDNLDKRLEQEDYGPILPPFAMYVFEVEQTLSQEDLSKWWQGVLPSAGEKATFEKFNISHDIKAGEIISPSVLNNDIFGGKLPKEMRFKIFKAKYRRNLTYNEIKNKSIYGTEPINSTFGYNYPHDFYSLIEMAKVDLGLEYEGEARPEPQSGLQNALNLLGSEEE